jgi:hypothetical protein
MYSLKCKYYDKEFSSLNELINSKIAWLEETKVSGIIAFSNENLGTRNNF